MTKVSPHRSRSEYSDGVKVLQLATGSLIVAKTRRLISPGNTWELEDPLQILYKEVEGQPKPRFVLFEMLVFAAEKTIVVKDEHVIYQYTPLPEILDQYNTILLNTLTKVEKGIDE